MRTMMQTLAAAADTHDMVPIHDLDFQNFYRDADPNGDGVVSRDELADLMTNYGIQGYSTDDFKSHYDNSENGGNDDGQLDMLEMHKAYNDIECETGLFNPANEWFEQEWSNQDKNGDGMLCEAELGFLYNHPTPDAADVLVYYDMDGDGYLNYEEARKAA